MEILVSKEDEDLLQKKWNIDKGANNDGCNRLWYARRIDKEDGKPIRKRMHRVIMERILGRKLLTKEKVDHIDFNGLNNRRENLRIASHRQNSTNRRLNKNNKSGYRGVHLTEGGAWKASIGHKGRCIYIGRYSTERDAAIAYDAVAKVLFKEFYNWDHHLQAP